MRLRRVTFLTLAVMSAGASAQALTVCPNGCDHASIQAAVNASETGGTIQLLTTTAHTEADIVITRSVNIVGIAENQTIVQAAMVPESESGRVFTILGGLTVSMQDITIRYGDLSPGDGGGIWIQSGSNLTLHRVTVAENRAANGGGVSNEGTLGATEANILQNTARGGRGSGLYNTGSAQLFDSSVNSNARTIRGGGVYNGDSASQLLLSNVTVDGNSASHGGGIFNHASMTITGSQINNNYADGDTGGGIYNSAPSLVEIVDTKIVNNLLESPSMLFVQSGGGGIYTETDLALINVTITGNRAQNNSGKGGGLFIEGGSAAITESRIAANRSVDGAGVYVSSGTVLIERSSFANNTSILTGAGIYSTGSDVNLTNVTIDNNRAGGRGGGVYHCRGNLELANVTVAYNTANADEIGSAEGGGVFLGGCDEEESARIVSTIIAENEALGGTYPDCEGVFSSGGFSLIGNNGPAVGLKCTVDGLTSGMRYNVDARLEIPSGFEPTRSAPLQAGSPAIDTGVCVAADGPAPTTDQRGAPMPVDGDGSGTAECDMGAYEYLSEPLLPEDLFADGFEN